MILALGIAVLTAAACVGVRWALERWGREDSSGSWVRLERFYNQGAAFGRKWPGRGGLVALSAGLLALLLAMIRRGGRSRLGLGLMLGGGASNLWERAVHGRVLDYLRFPRLPGSLGRTVFNLADLALFLGAALAVLRGGRGR